MVRKKTEIQAIRSDVAIYPIGVAARLLNVHPRTLRIYEQAGLIRPTIVGRRRMYSADDIRWVTCLRKIIHEDGISIAGLKKLMDYAPCWEVSGCPPEINWNCPARVDWTVPRTLHAVGEAGGRQQAKKEDQRKAAAAKEKKKRHSSG